MSERRSGLLLVGSEKQEPYLHPLENAFRKFDIAVTHRKNIGQHLSEQKRIELKYYQLDRALDDGERMLSEHLGRVARMAASLLVVNIAPDGDNEPSRGDFTHYEWMQLLANPNPYTNFFVHSIPRSSLYSHFTDGVNGLPSSQLIGGRLDVVAEKVYEVEGRRRRKAIRK
jgi:hypothetical protein